ncbi:unnamed protein product [Cylindrotheca closterium]|uniref:Mitochondrial proton/calcium exchanger protein n=1 Tax=Cylindrotheca closterium TaxID=2856 RepID=A0AAD2G9Z3_9STRA|nr:unnamed protein product [Cylindrotheca closterium]
MYNAIRRGTKLQLDKGKPSRLLVRTLGGTNPYESLTQQLKSRHSLSGSNRSIQLLTKPAYGDQLQTYAYNSNQRFREIHLPSTQSIPAACKIDNDDESSTDDKDLAYYRRSSVSQPTYEMRLSGPIRPFSGLERPKTSYRFESRLSFSSRPGRTGAKIPTPKTESSSSIRKTISAIDPMKVFKSGLDMTWYATKILVSFLVKLPGNTLYYIMNSEDRRAKIAEIKAMAKKEFDHYWTGSKLLMADVRTARNLLGRTLSGSTLTRRERKQLLRTVSDLFRLVPFSMFIIIPMMEFVLPFALRLFPNMLPSTFQDSLKSEENMKRELKSRIAMAEFFQDTLEELAKEQKRIVGKRNDEKPDDEESINQKQSAASMLEFLEGARNGQMMPPEVIIRYAKYFKDDLTLDNMPRMQLINMCKYMGITPYGSDNFLRFQLRFKIRSLKEDDQRILFEGINSLTKMELREACQDRGMRSTGLSKAAYKRSLQQWLELSVNFDVPISLLIMSRTYFLQEEMVSATTGEDSAGVAGLADAISGLDKDVLNEVILGVATSEEQKSDPEVRKIKLEVLSHQNKMIGEEQAEREKKIELAKAAAEELEAKSEDAAAPAVKEENEQSSEQKSKEPKQENVSLRKKTAKDIIAEVEHATPTGMDADKTVVKIVEDGIEVEDEQGEVVYSTELSADEIEAIEQLISADPVSKERQDLERIKSALKAKEESEEDAAENATEDNEQAATDFAENVSDDLSSATEKIDAMETKAAKEADESTVFTTHTSEGEKAHDASFVEGESEVVEEEPEPEEDAVVARLKKRIASMVDKIEVQLSKAEIQIGDKLHLLDKDNDGLLTQEEIVECLQQVLKRQITNEEAMELVDAMDTDGDGVLTVQELVSWLETNKLVKLESEGRDRDMDRILEGQQSGEEEKPDESLKQKQ